MESRSTYISCPDIGAAHLRQWWLRFSQYYVYVPRADEALEDLLTGLSAATKDFLSETRAAFDTAYDEYLDADLIDLDHLINRSDDDPADEFDAEPACGDCGGCCECLGDPPDCRWDTTAERDEELS